MKPNPIFSVVKLMRPKQWTKNVLVFGALIFSGEFFMPGYLLNTALGFLAFCLISSCVYILNDVMDREKDRLHPKKKSRPIVSGAISVPAALVFFAALLISTVAFSFWRNTGFGMIVCAYFLVNVAYSMALKRVVIVDIMCVAAGFVLRALSGSFLVELGISPWLIVCTMLLALFLAIHKRKSELDRVQDTQADSSRDVLQYYTSSMLHDMGAIIDSSTIMAYCLYTINQRQSLWMMLTIPLVIFGLFRYQLIIHAAKDLAESPDAALIKDKPLLLCVLLWGILCMGIIYFT